MAVWWHTPCHAEIPLLSCWDTTIVILRYHYCHPEIPLLSSWAKPKDLNVLARDPSASLRMTMLLYALAGMTILLCAYTPCHSERMWRISWGLLRSFGFAQDDNVAVSPCRDDNVAVCLCRDDNFAGCLHSLSFWTYVKNLLRPAEILRLRSGWQCCCVPLQGWQCCCVPCRDDNFAIQITETSTWLKH